MLVQERQSQPFRTVLSCVDFSETAPEFERHYRLLLEPRLKDFVGAVGWLFGTVVTASIAAAAE
jgi:hypothetical protein